jgi:hypothetical protein
VLTLTTSPDIIIVMDCVALHDIMLRLCSVTAFMLRYVVQHKYYTLSVVTTQIDSKIVDAFFVDIVDVYCVDAY